MTEEEKSAIRRLAKIDALELVIADLLATMAQFLPDPDKMLSEKREQFRAGLSRVTLRGYEDPAMSDMMVGEIADAVERVFEQAIDLSGLYIAGRCSVTAPPSAERI